ncbi:hypothetical protein LXL04_030461 [Taraxacum kok-saghyz]
MPQSVICAQVWPGKATCVGILERSSSPMISKHAPNSKQAHELRNLPLDIVFLIHDPNQRLGAHGSSEVKSHPFFNGVNWDTLAMQKSRSFENSYIPENPRTPKPLTFSKNRLRGAKNRSNLSPVAKKKFLKKQFFFSKTLRMGKFFFLPICTSLYNIYLKANFNYYERFEESRSRFFERNNGLGDIGNWGSSRVAFIPRPDGIDDTRSGGQNWKVGVALDEA